MEVPLISTVLRPTAWPTAPQTLSYSLLCALETCPRKWALEHADFPELWEDHGYPQTVSVAILSGHVVHNALEDIIRRLVQHGCTSTRDPRTVETLRELGGLTAVVRGAAGHAINRLRGNPRAVRWIDHMEAELRARTPQLRAQVQSLLSRLPLASERKELTQRERTGTHPLGTGTYAEVPLEATGLGWKGRADLIYLTAEDCEIRDYKTGQAKDDHALQLRIYAWLWWRDARHNPTGRLANRLVVSYGFNDVEIPPPTKGELEQIEHDLLARTKAILENFDVDLPRANIDSDVCSACGVRHLCDEYWTGGLLETDMPVLDPNGWFGDVECTVLEDAGRTSKKISVQRGKGLPLEAKALLLGATSEPFISLGLQLRLLNVRIAPLGEEEGSGFTIAPTSATEVFISPGSQSESP